MDVDETHNICVEDLKKINQNASAIIIVHLYGNPANLDEILKLKKKYKLKVIEDCAQAHRRNIKEKISTFGDVGTFSFPSKNLGCFGDGGCVVTNQKNIFEYEKKLQTMVD